ncbi:cupin domain-containing protein [Ensifer adhaerens]|uniref:cupin domain-containing protein n=1 Tax=Ensifer adhaerens TaxID=106592 RepID=UPI00132ED785|nr:cupin domain-containing protein [Ensifer adhaerens]QHG74966.1 cupin domain-containing protein [Ensifer adhaerens]
MFRFKATVIALFVVGGGFVLDAANARVGQIKRTDLVQSDISVEGHEAIQVRLDLAPAAVSIRHLHPGAEVIYVLKGSIEYHVQGEEPVTLHEGGALFIPAGVAHFAKNVGAGEASELATYIVEKGLPNFVPVLEESE